MRIFYAIVTSVLLLCGCVNKSHRSGVPEHDLLTVTEYNNEYDDNGIIKSQTVIEGGSVLFTTNYLANREETINRSGDDTTSYSYREYDEAGRMIREIKTGRQIGHGATFGQDNHEDLKNEMTYVSEVKQMIHYLLKMKRREELCKGLSKDSAKDFNKSMFEHSSKIFDYVKGFKWTITSDGQDYKPGGIGCYNRYRTITKKRAGMRRENTDSLEGATKARNVAVMLAKNLIHKRKCDGNHTDDGCEGFPPFTEAQWYYDCRYNQFDEERFE